MHSSGPWQGQGLGLKGLKFAVRTNAHPADRLSITWKHLPGAGEPVQCGMNRMDGGTGPLTNDSGAPPKAKVKA